MTRPILALSSFVLLLLVPALHAALDFAPLPDLEPFLTPANRALLERREVVQQGVVGTSAEGSSKGETVGLILVDAPSERILAVLEAFEAYPTWRSHTRSVRVLRHRGDRTDVEFVLTVGFSTIRYTVVYRTDRARGVLQWRLDDSRPRENIKDSVGAWIVRPYKDGSSLVAYTIQLDSGAPLPRFLQEWVARRSLPTSLLELRARAERR